MLKHDIWAETSPGSLLLLLPMASLPCASAALMTAVMSVLVTVLSAAALMARDRLGNNGGLSGWRAFRALTRSTWKTGSASSHNQQAHNAAAGREQEISSDESVLIVRHS